MRKTLWRLWGRIVKLRTYRAAIFLSILAVCFLVLSFAIHLPGLKEEDVEITEAVQEFRAPLFDNVMALFTFLGNSLSLCVVAGVFALYSAIRKRKHAAWLSVATLVGLPINMLFKEIVGRPRPERELVDVLLPTIGLSFPSGHAMASTMVYGFMAFLAWVHIANPLTRILCTVGLALTPILISMSRVYVGAHWFSDVIGGMTAGLFFLMIIARYYRKWSQEGPKPEVEEVKELVEAERPGLAS